MSVVRSAWKKVTGHTSVLVNGNMSNASLVPKRWAREWSMMKKKRNWNYCKYPGIQCTVSLTGWSWHNYTRCGIFQVHVRFSVTDSLWVIHWIYADVDTNRQFRWACNTVVCNRWGTVSKQINYLIKVFDWLPSRQRGKHVEYCGFLLLCMLICTIYMLGSMPWDLDFVAVLEIT